MKTERGGNLVEFLGLTLILVLLVLCGIVMFSMGVDPIVTPTPTPIV
jgi:hypothetical protein